MLCLGVVFTRVWRDMSPYLNMCYMCVNLNNRRHLFITPCSFYALTTSCYFRILLKKCCLRLTLKPSYLVHI